jgi:NTE family protein
MLVGTSAGSLNGAFLATDPTLDGTLHLGEIWKRISKDNIFPGNVVRKAWQLVTQQDSLCSRNNLIAFVQRQTPEGIRRFGQLQIPLYLVATDLLTGERYLFGEDPEDELLDGILASTAIPPIFSPWLYRDKVLVDGGISDNLPIGVAVEKGATEIFALDIHREGPMDDGHWNVLEVATLSLKDLIAQQRNRDLSIYASYPGVALHYLPLKASQRVAFDDFDQAPILIEDGRKAAEAYLAGQESLRIMHKRAGFARRGSGWLSQMGDFLISLVSRFNLSRQT